jgi:RHS repeat-associated protein
MSRRVRKQVFTHDGTAWGATPTSDTRFVYDGWNVLMELDGLNTGGTGIPQAVRKYTWGLDLSGSLHAAGGIGGLLAMQDNSGGTGQGGSGGQGGTGVSPVNYVYLYDANGNVGQLVNMADGNLAARYEYDPYGNALVADGPMAAANPFRFSTKYLDADTGQYYYGYRYYLPRLGRWGSRDPVEEEAGSNVYEFVRSSPPNAHDPDGRLVIALEGNRLYGDEHSGFGQLLMIGLNIAFISPKPEEFHLIRGTGLLGGGHEQMMALRQSIRKYKERKDSGCAEDEPLIVIGFSDGATSIYRVIQNLDGGGRLEPPIDFLALVDMVRDDYFPWRVNVAPNKEVALDRSTFNHGMNYLQQSSGLFEDNWKGHYFTGMDYWMFRYYGGHPVAHISTWGNIGILRVRAVISDIIRRARDEY